MKAIRTAFAATIAASLLVGCGTDPMAPTPAPTQDHPGQSGPMPAPLAAIYTTANDLTAASGGQTGQAWDISSRAIVVGQQDSQPFTWEYSAGRYGRLKLPAGFTEGGAAAISQDGLWIAGWGGSASTRAVLWDKNRRPLDLGTLGGGQSWATGVNADGNVVGWSVTTRGLTHAFYFDRLTRRMVDIGLLPGSPRTAETFAYAITDKGAVVGCSRQNVSGGFRMFGWSTGGGIIDLGAPAGGDACALAVNAAGLIAGWGTNAGVIAGMTWNAAAGFTFHATGPTGSSAQDVNLRGLTAGYDYGSLSAYVADRRGVVTFLPNLGWGLSFAQALNDCGDAVGFGSSSATHAIQWPSGACP